MGFPARDLKGVTFRGYRSEDMRICAKLALEAFPPGREDFAISTGGMSMEGYVESSLMWSNYAEVACVDGAVVGFLFGKIDMTWKDRSRIKEIGQELSMLLRWIVRDPLVLARSFGLMWNVWITELKVAENRPSGSDAEIELFIVDSRQRGKGIGTELINRFLIAARQAGSSVVTVYTEDLQSDYQFYEKRGFRRVATFHDDVTSYFANRTSNAIIFALDLRQSAGPAKGP